MKRTLKLTRIKAQSRIGRNTTRLTKTIRSLESDLKHITLTQMSIFEASKAFSFNVQSDLIRYGKNFKMERLRNAVRIK